MKDAWEVQKVMLKLFAAKIREIWLRDNEDGKRIKRRRNAPILGDVQIEFECHITGLNGEIAINSGLLFVNYDGQKDINFLNYQVCEANIFNEMQSEKILEVARNALLFNRGLPPLMRGKFNYCIDEARRDGNELANEARKLVENKALIEMIGVANELKKTRKITL